MSIILLVPLFCFKSRIINIKVVKKVDTLFIENHMYTCYNKISRLKGFR